MGSFKHVDPPSSGFSKAENSRQIGVEKLQVNEEIYKNNFRSVEENDHDIVPLEEALLINDPENAES